MILANKLILVFLFLLVSAYYLYPVCFVFRNHVEQALVPLGAELICHGKLLYRDMFTVNWPGSYLLLALFFKLFGASWLVCRSVLMATLFASGVLSLLLAKELLRGWLIFLPAAFLIFIAAPAWSCNYFYWDALFFFLGYTLSLTRLISKAEYSFGKAVIIGMIGGLAVTCFQPAILAVLSGMCVASWFVLVKTKNRQTALGVLASLVLGLVLVLTCMLIYLYLTHTLQHMVKLTLLFPLNSYSSVNTVPYGGDSSFFEQVVLGGSNCSDWLTALFIRLFGLLCWWPWLIVIGLPFLIALCITWNAWSSRSFGNAILSYPAVTLWFVMGFTFWTVELHRPEAQRLFWGGFLLLFLLLFFLQNLASERKLVHVLLNIFYFLTVLSIAVYAVFHLALFSQAKTTLQTRRGTIRSLEKLPILAAVESLTQPEEKVFVYPYDTSINFLTRTSFPSIYPWLQYNYHAKKDMQTAIEDIERSQVKYVVWDAEYNNYTFPDLGFPSYQPVSREDLVVENYLKEKYRFIKAYGKYRLMIRKSRLSL